MSFIAHENGVQFLAGNFLVDPENCIRKTYQFKTANAPKTVNGRKIYPSGTVLDDGIVYEDVDVTNGDMPGSLVVGGTIKNSAVTSEQKTSLTAKGFKFI